MLRTRQLVALGRAARRLFGLGHGELGCEPRRLRLERRDHVDVRGGIECRHDAASALSQDPRETPGALDQSLHAAECAGQVLFPARGQLGRGARGLGVEALEPLVQLLLLVLAHGQAVGRRTPTSHQVRQLRAGQIAANRQEVAGHGVVRASRRRLALERPDLAPHLANQVPQPLEVLGRGDQASFGPLPTTPVLENPCGLLDDRPAVLGTGVEHRVELALADDHVLLAAHTRVTQELLDVEQPTWGPVDGVLAVTGTKERPRDRHLGEVDGQLRRGVVDGQRDLGPPQRGPRGGAGEDDVLHLGGAK